MAESEKADPRPSTGDEGIHRAVSGRPPHAGQTVSQYLATRISTLKPPMRDAPNPFRLLAKITGMQWCFFAVAFVAWVSQQPPDPSCTSVANPARRHGVCNRRPHCFHLRPD